MISRYSTSRQKACYQCAAAKAKCDRKSASCLRCQRRGLPCSFSRSQPPQLPEDQQSLGADAAGTASSLSNLLRSSERRASIESRRITPESVLGVTASPPQAGLDFTDLDLICPINADDIANRWLNNFVPVPGQILKDYSPRETAFIHRMLNSYANASIRGRKLPPFIHWSQMTLPSSSPLSTCLAVIRLCDTPPLPGSDAVAAEVLQREMTKLYDQRTTFDDTTLLAAFQAYLIYAMVLFFKLGRESHAFLRQAMMNTQELACATARTGLMCLAEQRRARPKWEAWIAAEAKRRTLFTMCLFDSALLTNDGLPTHLAVELRGLFAPGSKTLWESRERRDWETKYNLHVADWVDGDLRIEELWPVPESFGEADITQRRKRVDMWLEDLDEFGTMIYSITSSLHGD